MVTPGCRESPWVEVGSRQVGREGRTQLVAGRMFAGRGNSRCGELSLVGSVQGLGKVGAKPGWMLPSLPRAITDPPPPPTGDYGRQRIPIPLEFFFFRQTHLAV